MATLNHLARVLEESVRRRGEVPMTNAHLLNCIRMSQRLEEREQEEQDRRLNEVLNEDKMWGSS